MAVEASVIFRVVNMIAAIFMIIGGVATIILDFPNFIKGIFTIIFGIITGIFEFRLPGQITQFASFMFTFFGRGIFYIFTGCINLNYKGLSIASGVIVTVIGVVYVVLHFVPNIQVPSNMTKEAFEESLGYTKQQYLGEGRVQRHMDSPMAGTSPSAANPPIGQFSHSQGQQGYYQPTPPPASHNGFSQKIYVSDGVSPVP